MRVYFVHLNRVDFAVTGGTTWQSAPIDLYRNNTYINYSLVRSKYGTGALGATPNNVWVGTGPTTGVMDGLRFIDTSGQINLVSFTANTPTYNGNVTLDVYASQSQTSHFPQEWAISALGRRSMDGLNDLFDVYRYTTLVLNFEYDPGEIDFYLRVEIDAPVIAPRYKKTRDMLFKLPGWMAMREVGNGNLATPELATPTSVGGAVVNAIAGEWLEDIQGQLDYRRMQYYIDTVDTNQKDWCYKTAGLPQFITTIVGDGIAVSRAVDLNEFYESAPGEDIAYWDEAFDILYTNRLYTKLTLGGVSFSQEPHQVWTSIDDLGLLVDLKRNQLEDNLTFQERIKDVYINPPGAGRRSFETAVRRELNLWGLSGQTWLASTPDSNALGATPNVLEMEDIEIDPDYMGPDGLPTKKFVTLVDYLAKEYPTTWGKFYWDKAFWDVGGVDYSGFGVLPQRMDATPLSDANTQSGVGDGDDLFVYAPDIITGPRNITAKLVVRGKQQITQTQYPTVTVPITVVGQATRPIYNNPPTQVWFTLEFQEIGVSGTSFYSFQLTSTSDIDVNQPVASSASFAAFRVFDADGGTNPSMFLQDKITGYNIGKRLSSVNISSIVLRVGQWSVASHTYINKPVSNTFVAWFSTNPTTTVIWNSDTLATPIFLSVLQGATPNSLPHFSVVMSSNQTSFVSSTWSSEAIPLRVQINNSPSTTTQSPAVVGIPNINWDAYISDLNTKKLVISITDAINVEDYDGNIITVDPSYVVLNGSNAWVGLKQTLTASTTANLTFTVNTGPTYPISGYTWSLFEYSQTSPVSVIVDENGPWQNNQQSAAGSNRQKVLTTNVGRSDFGIPQNANFIPQWVGVESSDPSIVVWLDTNSIAEDSNYRFQPLTIFARLNPDVSPEWNPQINSGVFYEGQQDYFLYASPFEEIVRGPATPLTGVVRQGAPVIVVTTGATPRYLRQTAFFDWSLATPAATPTMATPVNLSLYNSESVVGTGLNQLYASYKDVYSVTAWDVTDPAQPKSISINSTSNPGSNVIVTTLATSTSRVYKLQYKLTDSFYIDNDYVGGATPHSFIVFDAATPVLYDVTYESSIFNPATPINVALSPSYTTVDEGFIFISHDEYPLNFVSVYLSPSTIVANGSDYIVITLNAVDQYDNPKGNQTFSLTSSFGSLDKTSVTTDKDGFAIVTLTASSLINIPSFIGTISIAGAVTATVNFNITVPTSPLYRILAVSAQDEIRSNLTDFNIIHGNVQDPNFNGVANAIVNWKRARSTYDLFASGGIIESSGSTVADSSGAFNIGPFTAATPPGYWFVAVETNQASPSGSYPKAGDLVFWNEYPTSTFGEENLHGLSPQAIQMATPVIAYPSYSATPGFPVYYDETATPVSVLPFIQSWLPPNWYPIPWYEQHQMGVLPTNPHPSEGLI